MLLSGSVYEDEYFEDTIWFIESSFSDFYVYGIGEFAFYGLLIPVVIWSSLVIYNTKEKMGIIILVLFFLACGTYVCYIKYSNYCDEIEERERLSAIAERENRLIINRSFFGCNFGDSKSKVEKALKQYASHNGIIGYLPDGNIVLLDVEYGSRTYNLISFKYYKDKLCEINFIINKIEDNKKCVAIYEYFLDIFNEKGYPKDKRKCDKYNNATIFSDRHTELIIFDTYGVQAPYKVEITYYDKDSGYKEEGL